MRQTWRIPVNWEDKEDDGFAPRDWFEWICLAMGVMLIGAIVMSFTAGFMLLLTEACLLLGGVVLAWLGMAIL